MSLLLQALRRKVPAEGTEAAAPRGATSDAAATAPLTAEAVLELLDGAAPAAGAAVPTAAPAVAEASSTADHVVRATPHETPVERATTPVPTRGAQLRPRQSRTLFGGVFARSEERRVGKEC